MKRLAFLIPPCRFLSFLNAWQCFASRYDTCVLYLPLTFRSDQCFIVCPAVFIAILNSAYTITNEELSSQGLGPLQAWGNLKDLFATNVRWVFVEARSFVRRFILRQSEDEVAAAEAAEAAEAAAADAKAEADAAAVLAAVVAAAAAATASASVDPSTDVTGPLAVSNESQTPSLASAAGSAAAPQHSAVPTAASSSSAPLLSFSAAPAQSPAGPLPAPPRASLAAFCDHALARLEASQRALEAAMAAAERAVVQAAARQQQQREQRAGSATAAASVAAAEGARD